MSLYGRVLVIRWESTCVLVLMSAFYRGGQVLVLISAKL